MTIREAQGLVDGWIMSCANISQSKLLTSFLQWGGILLMLYPPHGGILLMVVSSYCCLIGGTGSVQILWQKTCVWPKSESLNANTSINSRSSLYNFICCWRLSISLLLSTRLHNTSSASDGMFMGCSFCLHTLATTFIIGNVAQLCHLSALV